jgi:hypothetical protein
MHIQDPEYWTPERLSKTYGISYEAVKRVLRSSYRSTEIEDGKDSVVEADGPAPASLARERTQRAAARMARDADSGSDSDIQSKWSNSPSTSNSYSQGKSYSRDDKAAKWGDAPGNRTSPVAAIRRAYGLKRQIEAETSARVAELEREREGENYPRPSRSPPSSRSSRD